MEAALFLQSGSSQQLTACKKPDLLEFIGNVIIFTGQNSHHPLMLDTSKYALFPGHIQLLTTSADDPTLWLLPEHQR